MNARTIVKFFTSGSGRLVIAFVLFGIVLLFIHAFIGSKKTDEKISTLETLPKSASNEVIDMARNVPTMGYRTPARPETSQTGFQYHNPDFDRNTRNQPPTLIPIGIGQEEAKEQVYLSPHTAPYGRLIKCKLVITVDSSNADTPIVGLTTEDVYSPHGDLIVPAGSEVHGVAQPDRERNRINSQGKWTIVYNTPDEEELDVNGIALNMEAHPDGSTWGITDGSAGLEGVVIKSDKFAELKLAASAFISAGIQGFSTTDNNNLTGTEVYQATPRNAALAGASAVANQYAQTILDSIKRDGFFVRVPAGKQFYLYVEQPIDRDKAQVGDSILSSPTSSLTNSPSMTRRPIIIQ